MSEQNELLPFFENEKEKHLDRVNDITALTKREARNPTDEEKDEIKKHMTAAADFQEKIGAILDAEALQEQVARLGRVVQGEPQKVEVGPARSLAQAFLTSDIYRAALKAGGGKWDTPEIEFLSAVGDPLLPQTANNDDAIRETFIPQLETPGLRQEAPTLADLFTQVQVASGTGPVVRYPILTTRTAASGAVVLPGGEKPYAEYAFDDATVTLAKRAAFVAIAEEFLEDAPYVASFINEDLPFMVRQNEETAFVTAFYTAVTQSVGAPSISGDNAWDAILAGVTEVRTNFFGEPDGLFIHPLDWAEASISKASTSGTYFSGGPNAAPSQNLWGTPARVVISSKAVQGFPIVGNFRLGGKVYRKGGFRLRASTSHEDFFQKNLVAILAEVRSALGITYPEAFAEINLAS